MSAADQIFSCSGGLRDHPVSPAREPTGRTLPPAGSPVRRALEVSPHAAFEPPAQAQAGFTLIEVMIVIGLMALVMAWGLPSMVQAVKKDALRKAVSDIIEGSSHARAQAIFQGMPAELIIRAEEGQILVQPSKTETSEFAPAPHPNGAPPASSRSGPAFSARLSDQIGIELLDVNYKDQMQMDEARVRFYPNGTCDLLTIVLQGETGERRKVALDIITGIAEVKVLR